MCYIVGEIEKGCDEDGAVFEPLRESTVGVSRRFGAEMPITSEPVSRAVICQAFPSARVKG